MMIHVQKWGNSLGVRIPSLIVKELGIQSGTVLEMVLKDHTLIIKPKKLSLEEMLHRVNPSHLHEEWGSELSPVGNEEW